MNEDIADFSTNPELALLRAEGEDDEADIAESFWLAGNALTSTSTH
jgi:hypothetical protein